MVARWWKELDADPGRRDLLVALVWLAIGVVLTSAGAVRLWAYLAIAPAPRWAFFLTLFAAFAVATLRSRRPMTSLVLGTAVALVDLSFGGSLAVLLILTDLIYAAVKYGNERAIRVLLICAGGGGVVLAALLLVSPFDDTASLIFLFQWLLIVAIPAMWGWSVRSERVRTRAVMASQQAASARHLRAQIAHDLHDLVANQIAVAGLHVEASKLIASRETSGSERLFRSLDQAKRGTDAAHAELRHLIAVLGAVDDLDETDLRPVATRLKDFAELLPADRQLVMPDDGPALAEALRTAPLAHQQVALRTLQELVVNAAKHGQGDVEIRTSLNPDAVLTIEVSNDYVASAAAALGSGLGIRGAGLLLGGVGSELEAGPEAVLEPGTLLDTRRDSGEGSQRWRARFSLPQELTTRPMSPGRTHD